MKTYTTASGSSAKVLIVDDDRRLLAAMTMRLGEIGCRCVSCTNTSEAMKTFAVGQFDLVITDLMMPGIDGLSVIGLIRSQSDVPLIVVTGHAPEYAAEVGRFNWVTLLRKPFDAQSLIDSVKAALPGNASRWKAVDSESVNVHRKAMN